jgi:TolA-binding protein
MASPHAGAQSATKADVQAMQEQMRALAERLNRLEAANTQLQTENTELKSLVDRRDAETDYLKVQTKELREESAVASSEIAKVKGADWATKIKARGDLRYRHEQIHPERAVTTDDDVTTVEDAEDRYRHRIRARLGFDAQVSDHLKTTLLLATGADDPRSSNQTLGSSSTRKAIGVDMAYADWNFAQGAHLILGKQQYPFYRPGQSLFFDGDFNPEGAAVKFERGMLFGSGYGWWLEERYNADPSGQNADTFVYGAQLGLKLPMFAESNLVAFAHYYDCSVCQNRSPLFNNSANGNTAFRVDPDPTNFLVFAYEIAELGAEFNTQLGSLPLQLWANYAQNMAPDVKFDTAYGAGFRVGRASNPGTWELGALYQSIEKDALFGQFVDSDFGDGKTDSEGWVLRGGYAPVRNIGLNLQYFLNTLNKDVGTELDYGRLQVDLNWKF